MLPSQQAITTWEIFIKFLDTEYIDAKEYHEKALIIRKKIFGEEHADVEASYNNLGNVHQDLEQYNEAKEYHEN